MRSFLIPIWISFMLMTLNSHAQKAGSEIYFKWSQLPAIPDQFGFAGSFAGVSNGALIVAGGANFPDGGAPWTGSKKVWSDKIFVLDKPDGTWRVAGKLPHPLGYGVSIVYNNQLICFGGSNADGHSKKVFGISYADGKISITNYPDMPSPLANSAGALVGAEVYIAGGLIGPDDEQAAHNFWCIDLAKSLTQQAWKQLPPWPGENRMLSVAGSSAGNFYLFSGASLSVDNNKAVKRHYLNDAYKYSPGKGWKKLADMPYATVAAAGPSYASNNNTLLVFGGDDGKLVDKASQLKDKHPGFSDKVLSYDIEKNKWHHAADIATDKKADAETHPNNSTWAPVTTSMILWNGSLVFPGGEVRPAVRTPRVLAAKQIIK